MQYDGETMWKIYICTCIVNLIDEKDSFSSATYIVWPRFRLREVPFYCQYLTY